MGFFGSLLSGALNIVSAISKTLAPALEKLLGPTLEKLTRAFTAFFRELGLLEPDMDIAELGDKALQAELNEMQPIKPENYDLYSDYIEAIKKYEPDPQLSARISPADMERKGIELESGLALEKFGEPLLDILVYVTRHPERFENGQWLQFFGKFINENREMLPLLGNYVTCKNQSSLEDDKAFSALINIEKNLSPEASDTIIFENIQKRISKDD